MPAICRVSDAPLVDRGHCIAFCFLQMHFFHYQFTPYCLSWTHLDLLNTNSICRNRRTLCFPKEVSGTAAWKPVTQQQSTDFPSLPKQKVSTLQLTFSSKPNKVSIIAAQENGLFLLHVVSFSIQTAIKLSLSASGITLDFPESNAAHCSCERTSSCVFFLEKKKK